MSRRSRATWLPASTLLLTLAGGTGTVLLPGSAQAFGLTGSFAPEQWVLNSYSPVTFVENPGPLDPPPGSGVPISPGFSQGVIPGSPPQLEYLCSDPVDGVNCVNILNASAGNFDVVGSDQSGNGLSGQAWSSQWEVVNTGPAKSFSFRWSYTGGDGKSNDQSFYYIDSILTVLGSTAGDKGTVDVTLGTGSRLGFGVITADNIGTAGKLQIRGFDAEPVPAPLPLLGAGAAFGWSRRLRSRIRRRAAGVTRG